MKRVLDTAVRKWGYGIPYNPIKDIEFPKGSSPRTRRLQEGEKELLLTAASSQRNIYIAPVIEFAIETGMRRSEILKLRWCDVDLENGFASLYDTKNGEDRRVPLNRRCIEVLKTVPQTHEQVFPISATCLRLAWNRARNKAFNGSSATGSSSHNNWRLRCTDSTLGCRSTRAAAATLWLFGAPAARAGLDVATAPPE